MDNLRNVLDALEYPNLESLDISRRGDLVTLISWLEDRKIRELEVSDRDSLRLNNESWDSAVSSYLSTLNCPFTWKVDAVIDCLTWVVNHAVSVEFEDIAEACVDIEAGAVEMETTEAEEEEEEVQGMTTGESCSSKIDEIGNLVEEERTLGESDADYLQRISRKIRLCLSRGAAASLVAAPASCNSEDSLAAFPLGFDTGDSVVNRLALVLRMLYLSDFRELQSDMNALIVLGQEYTANPRTNTSLGKVGR